MRVYVESIFDAPPEELWPKLLRPASLVQVAAPMARILPLPGETFPAAWHSGQTYRCRSYLWGFVPVGVRTIYLERVDADTGAIQSREHDRLIRRWDHLISVRPYGKGRSKYVDEVDLDAGLLTPAVWAWATLFYRHRQRRWRQLLRRRLI